MTVDPHRRALVALCPLLLACTTTADIDANRCGNFVLEPGEDCDSPVGCTSKCLLQCDPDAEVSTCPPGYVCGPADQACHRPRGEFHPLALPTRTFRVQSYAVGHVDGDGIADLIGSASGAVHTLFGSSTEPLERGNIHRAPFATATPAIGDFTGDRYPDVLIPSAGGIFALENRGNGITPALFPFDEDDAMVQLRAEQIGPADPRIARLMWRFPMAGVRTTELVIDDLNATSPNSIFKPCGIDLRPDDRPIGRRLDTFTRGPNLYLAMVVDRSAYGQAPLLCVDPTASAELALNLGTDGQAFFAELDGQPTCPELVFPFSASSPKTNIRIGVDAGGNRCTYSGFSIVDGSPVGHLPQLGLLVTSTGLHDRFGNVVLRSTRAWINAVSGDFDGDGREDFAAISFADDVEVILQRPGLGWRVIRVPTSGYVADIAAGDFDGDQRSDLALAIYNFDTLGADLYVSYSEGSTFTQPTYEQTIERYIHMSAAELLDPSIAPPTDLQDDLVVSHGTAPGMASILYGSTSRQLGAPWRPANRGLVRAAGVAVGRFGSDPERDHIGAISLFENNLCSPSIGPAGTTFLQIDRSPTTFEVAHELATCELKSVNSPVFARVPVGDRDLLLALSGASPSAGSEGAINDFNAAAVRVGAYLWSGDTTLGFLADQTFAPTGTDAQWRALGSVRSLQSLAGRPEPTLLVTGMVDSSVVAEAVEWTVRASSGGAPTLASPIALSEPIAAATGAEFARCNEVEAIEAGTRVIDGVTYGDGPELVMTCIVRRVDGAGDKYTTMGVYLVYAHPDDRAKDHVVALEEDLPPVALDIEVGDVSGDGIDDIVLVDFVGNVLLLRSCDVGPCGP